jgi:TrkA domain protein
VNVEVTPLPGIGTRQDFVIGSGRRIGVVNYRDGRLELIVSKLDDPDACAASIPLAMEEAGALANLLGAPQLVAQLREQQRDVTGIGTRQLPMQHGSPYDGKTLADTAIRTRTGASVVAVVRDGAVHPSPTPDFLFAGGDLVITVGTADGLDEAANILDHG